jgi:hypothetical protein
MTFNDIAGDWLVWREAIAAGTPSGVLTACMSAVSTIVAVSLLLRRFNRN